MNTPLGWPGGKTNNGLAKNIVSLLPPTKIYVEPFMGSLAVLFAKPVGPCEIVNDAHGELVNFFRVVKYHPKKLINMIQYTISSEEMYYRLKVTDTKQLNIIQRAFRFLYIVKNAYGQRYEDSWGLHAGRSPSYNSERLEREVQVIHKRLNRVQIMCRDYKDLASDTLDTPHTLYYLDPPYFTAKPDSGYGGYVHFKEFITWVRSIKKAKIAISHDYHKPLLRALPGWTVTEIGTRQNSLSRHKSGKSKGNNAEVELLITNFKPVKKSRRSFV